MAVGLGLVLAGSTIAWMVMADTASASANAFRFDSIYVATPDPDAKNETDIKLDVWFTNVEEARLRDIRIIAIVVDTNRNLETAKSEHRLGELEGEQTRNAEIGLRLNLSRPYRVDLLVLVDGLLVAKGEGAFGFVYYEHQLMASTQLLDQDAEGALKVDDFQIRYYMDGK
jgi:hypothetical protein